MLNTSYIYSEFKHKDYSVKFNVDRFPGCCGVGILYSCHFAYEGKDGNDTKENRDVFYKKFWEHLCKHTDTVHNRGVVQWYDAVKGEHNGLFPCLWEMGIALGADKTGVYPNRNSGRDVQGFAMKRDPIGERWTNPTPLPNILKDKQKEQKKMYQMGKDAYRRSYPEKARQHGI